MKVSLNTTAFDKQMDNFLEYSFGFLEGANIGKTKFFSNIGKGTVQALSLYIDSSARSNQKALHHVYEWYQTGSPSARLFNLNYAATGYGLSVNSTFKQSRTVSRDSNTAFYNKAKIMEEGIPVKIKPKSSGVLAFKENGEQVFTKKEITVQNPGGNETPGSFERVFDEFFKFYFTQAFLKASGLVDYIENPTIYKANLKTGMSGGRQIGLSTGFQWITNAEIGIE